jgi:hypothetical protein
VVATPKLRHDFITPRHPYFFERSKS